MARPERIPLAPVLERSSDGPSSPSCTVFSRSLMIVSQGRQETHGAVEGSRPAFVMIVAQTVLRTAS